MSMWEQRTLLEDMVARGVDDWVYAAEVFDIASRTGLRDPVQLRALAIGLIAEALVRGLMIPGEFDGVDHRPWECSTGEAIARITEEWLGWGDDVPTSGAIVWLALTPAVGKSARPFWPESRFPEAHSGIHAGLPLSDVNNPNWKPVWKDPRFRR